MAHTTFIVAGELTPAQQRGILDRIADLGLGAIVDRVDPKFTYKIEQDQDADSPRGDDNLGVLACDHKRYDIGDKDYTLPFVDGDWRAGVLCDNVYLCLDVWGYEHGGIALSHTRSGQFADQFDSGRAGWHYVTNEAVKEWYGVKDEDLGSIELRDKVERALKAELEEMNHYLAGEVWGYVIKDEEGDTVDSCWGFRGDSKEVPEWMADNAGSEHLEGLRKAWDDRFN